MRVEEQSVPSTPQDFSEARAQSKEVDRTLQMAWACSCRAQKCCVKATEYRRVFNVHYHIEHFADSDLAVHVHEFWRRYGFGDALKGALFFYFF